MKDSVSLAYAEDSTVGAGGVLTLVETAKEQLASSTFESEVFHIQTRKDDVPRVLVIGRASRKHTTRYVSIPIGESVRERLEKQIVGSLAMGLSGLLEWALRELELKRISLEVKIRP